MEITRCKGEGLGSCKRCSDKGKWNRTWMCFLYKIDGLPGCYCAECVKEIASESGAVCTEWEGRGEAMAKIYNFSPVNLHAGNKNAKRQVIAIYSNGKFCKFPSIHAAASLMNIPEPNIVACLKGRIKTSGGCRWVYADEFDWKDVCGTQPQREDEA